MKRGIASLAGMLLCLCALAQGQSPKMVQFLKEFPQRAAFNTHSYEFIDVQDTPAPAGYQAFYISHYGRHGSRSEWGGMAYAHVRDVLTRAKEDGVALTPAGDSLLRESAYIFDSYNGMDGRLTPRGVREHARLADRMYHRFPEVFTQGCGQIRAVSSTVPRCIVSMNGFTAQLKALQPSLEIDLDTGETYMEYIARAETGTISERTRNALAERNARPMPDTVTVFRNLFQDPEAGKQYVKNVGLFQYAIYATAKVAEAFDIDDNLFRYLPFDNVYRFHESNFLSAYLNQCNSELNGDLRLPRAKMLVDVLIGQADAVIDGKRQRAADLCFGHDWPYLGLVSYLGLEGVGDRLSVDEAADHWMASWNCPFAANLQMIFYRKAGAPVLVKFLVNERETAIPALQPVTGPYYKWDDVKAFCATRVPSVQIVAHRGYWDLPGGAQNSIASLKKAQEFGCWGSEFDLHLTADDVVVVNHDATLGGVSIQSSPFDDIRGYALKNGEQPSTLDDYLTQGGKNADCILVLELKPHKDAERENVLIDRCLEALKAHKLLNPKKVVFISFSYHICRELARRCPGYTVQYLEGDKAPALLHADGITGIDYHYNVLFKHPEWVDEAHSLGMSVNAWTVDDEKDMKKLIGLGVDQITTNDPALLREILYGRK